MEQFDLMARASGIVSAYVANNPVPASELPALIKNVVDALSSLARAASGMDSPVPQVPIKRSVTADYIVCLEDGKKLKMLKRYLRSRFGMTPDEYRAKWGLPVDYPMVAPNYSKTRSDFAKKIGLGRAAPGRRRKR